MMKFWRGGDPFIWLTGGALIFCLAMISGLVGVILYQGASTFWPQDLTLLNLENGKRVLGKIIDRQQIPGEDEKYRLQLKVGNRDTYGLDFRWVDEDRIASVEDPLPAVVFERVEWGDMYGFMGGIYKGDELIETESGTWHKLEKLLEQAADLHEQIHAVEHDDIGALNRKIEDLRLERRRLEREGVEVEVLADNENRSRELWNQYESFSDRLDRLRTEQGQIGLVVILAGGQECRLRVADIVRVYRPNLMTTKEKMVAYASKGWEFIAGEPRESNTEGGIFPALFGTVMMVVLMSLAAVPFGILAALYLREYAGQGFWVKVVRVAVNNLAGVPSIVFGMFGLGFFVYGVGGSIDQLFYADALPTPTYGTGGILWASLTLALLTVPVVIVSTEEALAAVSREIREGALALGSTQFQMIWNVVLPSALPGILTGVILATARGAGEVAPLMITGVVKLAPDLPIDAFAPFFHLERKFMHLGFHIYDVGFQSPNVEAARPMVYTTALLLLTIVLGLNLTAIVVRNKLRKKYATSVF